MSDLLPKHPFRITRAMIEAGEDKLLSGYDLQPVEDVFRAMFELSALAPLYECIIDD